MDKQELYDLLYTKKIDVVDEFRIVPIVLSMSRGFNFLPGEVIFPDDQIIFHSEGFGAWNEYGWSDVEEIDIVEIVIEF